MRYEEGVDDPASQEGVTLFPVALQGDAGRLMNRHQPGLAELRVADGDDALVEIDILQIEVQDFADPHPGDADQAIDRIAPQAVEPGWLRPHSSQACRQNAPYLLLAEDMGLEG